MIIVQKLKFWDRYAFSWHPVWPYWWPFTSQKWWYAIPHAINHHSPHKLAKPSKMTNFCILGIFHWVIGPTDIRFEISASRRSFWHPCRSFIHSRSWEIHFFSFLGGFHWVIGPTDMIFEISASRRSFWHPCRFFNYYRSRVRLKGYIADFFEHSIKPPT